MIEGRLGVWSYQHPLNYKICSGHGIWKPPLQLRFFLAIPRSDSDFVGKSLTSFLLVALTLSYVAEHIKDVAAIEMKPSLFPTCRQPRDSLLHHCL